MSDPIRPYEPLTSENAALVLVDHQVGLMTGVRDYSTGELKHNVVALAKAAKALKLPIIVTCQARRPAGCAGKQVRAGHQRQHSQDATVLPTLLALADEAIE